MNCGIVRLPILHTLTRDAVSSFNARIEINLTESSCKLTEKCFSYIIKELLNWYWCILALVGFKMHSQARAFLQPTPANIHQYQFNNPILYWMLIKYIIYITFKTIQVKWMSLYFLLWKFKCSYNASQNLWWTVHA